MLFGHSSRLKALSTERFPKAITLGSASDTIDLGVHPNESEDLSISERIWVAHTHNDFMASLDIGALPLEDAWEDVSLVIWVGPTQGEPARVPSVGARGKEPITKAVHGPGPSEPSLEVIPKDDLKWVLLWIDSPA